MTDEWIAGTGAGRPLFNTNCRVNRRSGPTPIARPCWKGCSTARSTASPPTRRPTPASTRTASSTRPRPGISMLETAFGLLMRLVDAGQLDLRR